MTNTVLCDESGLERKQSLLSSSPYKCTITLSGGNKYIHVYTIYYANKTHLTEIYLKIEKRKSLKKY